MKTKRIGFIDKNLENYHANVFLKAIRQDLKDFGFDVGGCYGLEEEVSKAWAETNKVRYFSEVSHMEKEVDYLMVLAPSNPEVHWELCQKAFPLKKPTYVDKTFAPSLEVAKQLFALADQNGAVIQTTSALRYTCVQKFVAELKGETVRHMVAWGGGGSFSEYAIHPLELTISCMGADVLEVRSRGQGEQRQILLDFTGGRTAVVNVYAQTDTPFMASVTTQKKTSYMQVDGTRLFMDTARGILSFFESGVPNIDRSESLAIRRILDDVSV